MYMTRVILKNVPPPNIIHGILSAAFPGKRSDQVNEALWRIDNLRDKRALIIVSAKTPDRQLITQKMGINKINTVINDRSVYEDKTLDYEPFLEQIDCGQSWNFRLCANPVEHKKIPGKRGKICAYRTVFEQIEWLKRQSIKYGFNIKSCSVISDEWKRFNNVTIRAVTFDGLLTINDTDAFREALIHGIGRGKAYGCGLLTIAKVQL